MANHHSHTNPGNGRPNPNLHLAEPSIPTQNHPTRPAMASQGDDIIIPTAFFSVSMEGFSIYLQVWNSLVNFDRQGRSLDHIDLRPAICSVIQANFKDDGLKWQPFAEAVVSEYKERRILARNPLRFKTEKSLSTIPMIGPLASLGVQDAPGRRLLRRKDGTIVAIRPWSEE